MTSFVGVCGKYHWSVKMAAGRLFIHKDRLARQLASCPHVHKPRRGMYKLHKHPGALWRGSDSLRVNWQFSGNPWQHTTFSVSDVWFFLIIEATYTSHRISRWSKSVCIAASLVYEWLLLPLWPCGVRHLLGLNWLPNFLLHGSFLHFKATWFPEAVSASRLWQPARWSRVSRGQDACLCLRQQISAEKKMQSQWP